MGADADYRLVATLLKVVFRFVPRVVMVLMMTTAMKAKMATRVKMMKDPLIIKVRHLSRHARCLLLLILCHSWKRPRALDLRIPP